MPKRNRPRRRAPTVVKVKTRNKKNFKKSRRQRRRMLPMSVGGLCFLKCAFASPDFSADPGFGIPDNYAGRSLMRKDNVTSSISFTQNKDTFILVTPTPGIAYWKAEVSVGSFPDSTTSFLPVAFPGTSTIFGDPAVTPRSADNNVNAFRYASMNAGVYPTSNQMQFSGSITVWKCPARSTTATVNAAVATIPPTTIPVNRTDIAGLDGATAVPPINFATSFINGAYTTSVNSDADFDFSDLWYNTTKLPLAVNNSSGMPFTLDATGASTPNIYGWGKMDTIVIRVSTPTAAVNTALLKVWACLEYKPTVGSSLDQFCTISPDLDLVALQEYRRIARELPVAVICAENAKFWDMVKRIMGFGLGVATMIPGPVGMAASGVSTIAQAFGQMGLG